MKNDQEISLSIEETNKLRISLGLKPLEINVVSKAEENFKEYQQDLELKNQRRELKETIQKSKKKVLKGVGLGVGVDESTEDWAQNMQKRAKEQQLKIARKKMQEEELIEYTEVKGVKVSHDIDSLDQETVLVLKDTLVQDDQEDELINVNLLDKEKIQRNLNFKKGKKKYNPYEEFEREQMGLEKRILAQYDDDDQPTGFVLSGGIVNVKEMEHQEIQQNLKKGAISLEYEKSKEIQDYYTKDEMLSFRKPKKKKKLRKRKLDQVEGEVSLIVHEKFVNSNKKSIDSMNFVDDDDLQDALSKVRKATNRKILSDPAEIALRILEQEDEVMVEHTGMVLSDLTEFVANIEVGVNSLDAEKVEGTTNDVILPSNDTAQSTTYKEPIKDVEMEIDQEQGQEEETHVVLEEEPLVADGLAATLKLLQRKGDLDTVTDDQLKRQQLLAQRAKWIAEQRIRDAQIQKELEEETKRLKEQGKRVDKSELDRRQRELERERVRAVQDKFKDYKPAIELRYTDQVGRELDSKQAFKEMSQKFHGKKAGKKKIEKQLTRMGEEMKLKHLLDSDTKQSHGDATRDLGHAHITLSVGNKPYCSLTSVVSEFVEASGSVQPVKVVKEKKVEEVKEVVPVVFKTVQVQETPVLQSRPKIAFGLKKKLK